MNFKEYIEASKRTDADLGERNSVHWQLGIFNEFGELTSPLKKSWVKNENPLINSDKLTDELGDVCWYLAKGCRITNFEVSLTYAYEERSNIIDIIKSFCKVYIEEDIMGMFCTLQNFCNLYEIDFEEALDKNIAKLQVRHPEGFNINNLKHTKEELDAIK
jgi:NTP pyrophosphatase (non-canonical NTP hydrolase)